MANRITSVFDFKSSGLSKVKADIAGVDGAWGKLRTGVKSSVQEFKSSAAAQTALAAGAAAVAAKAITAASNLEESVNAVNVAYGQASEGVHKLGEDSAESFGMSQTAFNSFAVQFSAFAGQIASESGRDIVDVLDEITTRVADFASVNNLDMAESGRIVMSTLAGETEAFRRYGGDVSAATIKTIAYAEGIAEAGEELTEQQKVLARHSAFMQQTEKTAGDFANTSDGLANSSRILSAQVEDLSAKLGEGLLPAASGAASALTEISPVIEKQLELFGVFADKVGEVTSQLGAVAGGIDGVQEANSDALLTVDTFSGSIEVLEAHLRRLGVEGDAAAEFLEAYKEKLEGTGEATTSVTDAQNDFERALHSGKDAVDIQTQAMEAERTARANAIREKNRQGSALRRLDAQFDHLTGEIEDNTDALDDNAWAMDKARVAAYKNRQELDGIISELERETAFEDLSQNLQDIGEDGEYSASELRDFKLDVIDFGDRVADLPPSVITEILAMIDNGEYQKALDRLNELSKAIYTPVIPVFGDIPKAQFGSLTHYHGGTSHAQGGPTVVGEHGPELVNLPRGSKVTPNHAIQTSSGGGQVVNVDVRVDATGATDPVAVGRHTAEALEQFFRAGGQIPPSITRRVS